MTAELDLASLAQGGTALTILAGVLGFVAKQAKEERADQRAQLAEERARHKADLDSADREEAHLRGRLDDAETVIKGLKDRVADGDRESAALRASLAGAEAAKSWMQNELARAGGPATFPPPPFPPPAGRQ